MGNSNPNGGRGAPVDDNRPSWRPQDQPSLAAPRHRGNEDDHDYGSWRERNQDRPMTDRDPSRWEGSRGSELGSADEAWRSAEHHGPRPSGYSTDRYSGDRSHPVPYRDDMMRGAGSRDVRDFGGDHRLARGGFESERGSQWSAYDGPPHPAMDRNDMRGKHASEPSWGNQMGGSPGPHAPRGTGPHRGKGPVGYQRSDERIRELVSEALTDDDQIDASQIHVMVKDGEVTLTGLVDDRRTRREVEDCVAAVSGVRDVLVQLRVKDDRQGKAAGASSQSDAAAGGTSEAGAAQDKKPRA